MQNIISALILLVSINAFAKKGIHDLNNFPEAKKTLNLIVESLKENYELVSLKTDVWYPGNFDSCKVLSPENTVGYLAQFAYETLSFDFFSPSQERGLLEYFGRAPIKICEDSQIVGGHYSEGGYKAMYFLSVDNTARFAIEYTWVD